MADSLKSKAGAVETLRKLAGFSRETLAQYTVAINSKDPKSLPRNSKLEGLELKPRPTAFESVAESTIRNTEQGEFITRSKLVAIAYALDVALEDIAHLDGEKNPFLGLSTYQVENRSQYFGRSQEIDRALSSLSKSHLLAVIGNSGAGKSSFILAGVLPKMADQQDVSFTVFEPGDAPLRNLVDKVFNDLNENASGLSGTEFEQKVAEAKQSSATLEVWLRQLGNSKPNKNFVIVVDQWEQLYAEGCEDSQQFIALLTQASRLGLLTVLLTVRADFYGDVIDGDQEFFALFDKGRFELAQIGEDGLREIITGPKALDYEIGVVETLVKQAIHNDGSLPLLSFVLEKLWNSREPKTGWISNEVYHTCIGDFDQAIGDHAQYCFDQLIEEEQDAARLYLPSLVNVIDREGDLREIRGSRRLAESSTTERQLIEYLSGPDCRIIRIVGENDPFVELAHEILLRAWHDLRGWVNDDRDFWVERNKIVQQAEVFRSDSKAYLQGKQLKHALALLSKYGKSRLGLAESEFIEASARHKKWRSRRLFLLVPICGLALIYAYKPFISPNLVNFCPIDATNYSIMLETDRISDVVVSSAYARAEAYGEISHKGVQSEVVALDVEVIHRAIGSSSVNYPTNYQWALSFNSVQGSSPCCWLSVEESRWLEEDFEVSWLESKNNPLHEYVGWESLKTGTVRIDDQQSSRTTLQVDLFDRVKFEAIGCQPIKLLRYWLF